MTTTILFDSYRYAAAEDEFILPSGVTGFWSTEGLTTGTLEEWPALVGETLGFTGDSEVIENAQNGWPVVDISAGGTFSGADSIGQYITDTDGTVYIVAKVNAIATDNADALAYNNPSLWRDGAGYVGHYMRSTGPRSQAYVFNGISRVAGTNFTTGAYHVFCWRLGGGVIAVSIDGGAEATTATGAIDSVAGNFVIGDSDSLIGDTIIYNVSHDASEREQAIGWLMDRWAI